MTSWKDGFYYTKSERKGIFAFVILIIAIFFLPKLYPLFIKQTDQSEIEQQIEELKAIEFIPLNTTPSVTTNNLDSTTVEPKTQTRTLPNSTNKTTSSVEVNEQQTINVERSPITKSVAITKVKPIEINAATVSEWKQLPGIGEVFSNRIVKFRNKLGGFYSIQQVSTTYGIDEETFQVIYPYLTLNSGVQQLSINSATEKELSAHPYISPNLAKQMINYREKVKSFESDQDLKSLYFVDEELFQKLKPYIQY